MPETASESASTTISAWSVGGETLVFDLVVADGAVVAEFGDAALVLKLHLVNDLGDREGGGRGCICVLREGGGCHGEADGGQEQ